MKIKNKYFFLYFVTFFVLLFSATHVLGFTPQWKPGDTWVVAVSYAQAFGSQKWSEPVYWNYSISDAGNEDGPELILEARNHTDNSLGLRVWLSDELTPVKVQTVRKIRGRKEIRETVPESDFPVLVGYTPTPFDFPVFPLEVPSTKNFTRIRSLSPASELRTSENLCQESRSNIEIPERYDIEPQQLIEVKVLSREQETLFLQYWDKNLPWPLYGENRNMKYRLVQK